MALSRDRKVRGEGELKPIRDYPVKADAVIFNGAIVHVDATGYLVPGDTTGTNKPAGIAQGYADATGLADGDLKVAVAEGGAVWFKNSGVNAVVQADVGNAAYCEDDETVDDGTAGAIKVGKILKLDASLGVLVDIGRLAV